MNGKIIKNIAKDMIADCEHSKLEEMNNLIRKALFFYCSKYKKRFNFKVTNSEIWADSKIGLRAGIHFNYDNRKYCILLNQIPTQSI